MIVEFCLGAIGILSLGAGFLVGALKYSKNQIRELKEDRSDVQQKLKEITNTLASIRVKHGQTWENFMPLMSAFEAQLGPKENATFLGQPIDLVYFNDNEIVFVEVKTGNSRLSQKQRHIRNLVTDKKIRWAEVNDSWDSRLPNKDFMKTIEHRV